MIGGVVTSSVIDDQPDIAIRVPVPPSANALWAHPGAGKPRTRSDAYRTWLHDAGWTVRAQCGGLTPLACTFDALLLVPAASRRDRDNWSKPIFDLLQIFGVIRNDSGLRDYSVRGEDRPDCLVLLWDRGGPEQREPRPTRVSKPSAKRWTPQQIARARKAGVLA